MRGRSCAAAGAPVQRATMHGPALPTTRNPTCAAAGALSAWVSSRLIDDSSVSDSEASKPQHCAVSGPACRLRCRPTTLAPPNQLLRKFLAEEGLPRAARRQVRNPPDLRPLGHAPPPTRTRHHLGAASHRARYAGEADRIELRLQWFIRWAFRHKDSLRFVVSALPKSTGPQASSLPRRRVCDAATGQ